MAQQPSEALDRAARAFERVASTTERVGIPVATFAVGAVTIFLSTIVPINILPWLGAALILASLGTYLWLTARSTIKMESPPRPIQGELKDVIDWMMGEITESRNSARDQVATPRQGPG